MFEVKVIDVEARNALKLLEAQSQNMSPVYAAIARRLHNITEDAFDKEASPFGQKWKPVAREGRILQKTGRLAGSVGHDSGASFAELSVGTLYAAIHQFGGKTRPHIIEANVKKALAFGGKVFKKVNHPGSNIPARPYMPVDIDGNLAPAASAQIIELVEAHILKNQ